MMLTLVSSFVSVYLKCSLPVSASDICDTDGGRPWPWRLVHPQLLTVLQGQGEVNFWPAQCQVSPFLLKYPAARRMLVGVFRLAVYVCICVSVSVPVVWYRGRRNQRPFYREPIRAMDNSFFKTLCGQDCLQPVGCSTAGRNCLRHIYSEDDG